MDSSGGSPLVVFAEVPSTHSHLPAKASWGEQDTLMTTVQRKSNLSTCVLVSSQPVLHCI